MRDKFRMQHSGSDVVSSEAAAADQVSGHGNDSRMQDGYSTSAANKGISCEEIRPLDRSPQRAAAVRGRRDSAGKEAPGPVNATVSNSGRGVDVPAGSTEKVVCGEAVSLLQGDDNSREGGPQRISGRSRPRGHVSDGDSRRDRTTTSGARRTTGYVSDNSFSAAVHSTATEGMCLAVHCTDIHSTNEIQSITVVSEFNVAPSPYDAYKYLTFTAHSVRTPVATSWCTIIF